MTAATTAHESKQLAEYHRRRAERTVDPAERAAHLRRARDHYISAGLTGLARWVSRYLD
jgi:hypothetical protein